MSYNTLSVEQPADQAPRKTITITHNRAEGTLIDGSCRGDGVWEIIRQPQYGGFRSSRNIGLYLPQSRDKAAKQWKIDAAASALRAAGFEVVVEVDNVTAGRDFAEAEADRVSWAEDRTDRYAKRADRNAAEGDARWRRSDEGLPDNGQPILVGHHSERRHRKALERAHNNAHKAIDLQKKAAYWANRAEAAGAYEEHRNAPGRTLRRIDKLEASRRRIVRGLEEGWHKTTRPGEEAPAGATLLIDGNHKLWRVEPSDEYKAQRQADLDQIDDELGYWRHVIEEAAKNGVKIWSKADFAKGDFVLYRYGAAVEVTRVNAKSVTIPWAHYWVTSGPLVTVEAVMKIVNGDGHMSGDRMHTDTIPYDDVKGRLSKEEVAELLARKATVGEFKELIAAKIREARGESAPEQSEKEPTD